MSDAHRNPTTIHVGKNLQLNKSDGRRRPPLTIWRPDGTVQHAHEVIVHGASRFRYTPEGPPVIGRDYSLWLETDAEVEAIVWEET